VICIKNFLSEAIAERFFKNRSTANVNNIYTCIRRAAFGT